MLRAQSRLEDLPPEIFSAIAACLDDASNLASLSRTSKALRRLTDVHGWRAHLQHAYPWFDLEQVFPSLHTKQATSLGRASDEDRIWHDAVRTLSTTARNWDKRAFQCSFIQPRGDITQLQPKANKAHSIPKAGRLDKTINTAPDQAEAPKRHNGHRNETETIEEKTTVIPKRLARWRPPSGQTLGFTAVIDSYEALQTHKWTDRKEVIAYSAGSELVLRIKQKPKTSGHDVRHYHFRWTTYRPQGAREGVDDISFVKLLSSEDERYERVLFGTTSGALQQVSVRTTRSKAPYEIVKTRYQTGGRPVQAACANRRAPISDEPTLLASVLGEGTLSVHHIQDQDHSANPAVPVSEAHIVGPGCRAWRASFLNPTTLALGTGPSTEPIKLYTVTPSGLHANPTMTIPILDGGVGSGNPKPKTVYPIEPLWDGCGRVFASGGFDGHVRVHDTRAPPHAHLRLQSTLLHGPIYSLLARPNHRIVAGAAQHGVCKVFDLRASTNRVFTESLGPQPPLDAATTTTTSSPSRHDLDDDDDDDDDVDYNLFLLPPRLPPGLRPGARTDGPVYSLSSPSPASPFLYLGVEKGVAELQLDSLYDHDDDHHRRDPLLEMTTRGRWEDELRDEDDEQEEEEEEGASRVRKAAAGRSRGTRTRSRTAGTRDLAAAGTVVDLACGTARRLLRQRPVLPSSGCGSTGREERWEGGALSKEVVEEALERRRRRRRRGTAAGGLRGREGRELDLRWDVQGVGRRA